MEAKTVVAELTLIDRTQYLADGPERMSGIGPPLCPSERAWQNSSITTYTLIGILP